jgi:hypothetical protein
MRRGRKKWEERAGEGVQGRGKGRGVKEERGRREEQK